MGNSSKLNDSVDNNDSEKVSKIIFDYPMMGFLISTKWFAFNFVVVVTDINIKYLVFMLKTREN